MYYRLPKSELSLKYEELLNLAYFYLYKGVASFSLGGLVIDKGSLFYLAESLSILRSITGIQCDLDEEGKTKLSLALGEDYDFIKNLVVLRNSVMHAYDRVKPENIKIDNSLNSVLRKKAISKARRYFNGCKIIKNKFSYNDVR